MNRLTQNTQSKPTSHSAWFAGVLALSLTMTPSTHAGSTERTTAAGALGGVIGAAIGQHVGGQTGAMIGAGIGAGAGGAVASNSKDQRQAAAIGGLLGGSAGYSIGNSTNTAYGGHIGAAVGGASGAALGSKIAVDREHERQLRAAEQRRLERQRHYYHRHEKANKSHAKKRNHGQHVSYHARNKHR
ncbi:MAG: glycine zipper 2TM domain-containing protein [Pseudomonadota bacterium]|nr:glycine zipper 2TM domain-containing protein [Pseudomonadota bacterium]